MDLTTSRSDRDRIAPSSWLNAVWSSVVVASGLFAVYALNGSTKPAALQHLYYLPIIFASIRFGIWGGTAAALAAVVLYHLGDPRLLTFQYGHYDIVQIVLFGAVAAITAKLVDDARRLRLLAMTDDLTGLHNLRSFEAWLRMMVRGSRRDHSLLALLVIDVDRLKALNDEYGHLAGADAVRTVGHIIADRAPCTAVACRYGGDEFVIAVPDYTVRQANWLADRLRLAVNDATPNLAGVQFPEGALSVSIGVACRLCANAPSGSDEELGEALFRAADAALYRAKNEGRNHVCLVAEA